MVGRLVQHRLLSLDNVGADGGPGLEHGIGDVVGAVGGGVPVVLYMYIYVFMIV